MNNEILGSRLITPGYARPTVTARETLSGSSFLEQAAQAKKARTDAGTITSNPEHEKRLLDKPEEDSFWMKRLKRHEMFMELQREAAIKRRLLNGGSAGVSAADLLNCLM